MRAKYLSPYSVDSLQMKWRVRPKYGLIVNYKGEELGPEVTTSRPPSAPLHLSLLPYHFLSLPSSLLCKRAVVVSRARRRYIRRGRLPLPLTLSPSSGINPCSPFACPLDYNWRSASDLTWSRQTSSACSGSTAFPFPPPGPVSETVPSDRQYRGVS